MKKLLVLLALCMVFSVALVACENEPQGGEQTTDEVTTEAPTTEEPTTEEPTTEAPTTEEPTTEEPTTEEPTTEEPTTEEPTTEPPVDPQPVSVIAALSGDTVSTIHPVWNKTLATGGTFISWDGAAEIDTNDSALYVYGWIAFYSENLGTVVYTVDGGEQVHEDSFTTPAEGGVMEHLAKNHPDAKSACRFSFEIPLTELGAGTHKVCLYAKDTDGNVQLFKEITLNIVQVDPVQPLTPVEYNGTNGKITLEANGTYKFTIVNQGGKTMTIVNSANCDVIAGTYTLPAETIKGNNREQFIPGPNEGWDSFVLTIHNNGDAAVEIELTIQ